MNFKALEVDAVQILCSGPFNHVEFVQLSLNKCV